jgi:hypothetical protein
VVSHDLVFCDEVVMELAHVAKDEYPHVWAKAVRDSRADKGAPYSHVEWVVENVPELVDPDVEFEACGPCVLAQARHLGASASVIYVVSEDAVDKPTRISLITACSRVGIASLSLVDCFKAAGLGALCV